MTRAALALCGLVFAAAGCSPPTAQQRAAAVQAALAGGKAACLVLAADATIPREADVDAYCETVLRGCR